MSTHQEPLELDEIIGAIEAYAHRTTLSATEVVDGLDSMQETIDNIRSTLENSDDPAHELDDLGSSDDSEN